jgi:hypothetical protein
MTHTRTYSGSCHCGEIGFSYRTDQPPGEWSIRACQCAFCRAHGALSTSDSAGQIEFRGGAALNRYRFGQRTADFLVCRECGVYVGAVMETPRGRYGIVNVNAISPAPMSFTATVPMDYGSESKEQRVARREARWSPVAPSSA